MSNASISNSSFIATNNYSFYDLGCLPYEKRVSNHTTDPNSQYVTAIKVHFLNLSEDEKATGILKKVNCAYAKICGKYEMENWGTTNLDVKADLNTYYFNKFGGSLQQVNSLWIEVKSLESKIAVLESQAAWKKRCAEEDIITIPFPFFPWHGGNLTVTDERFAQIYHKNKPATLIIYGEKLSPEETTEGILKNIKTKEITQNRFDLSKEDIHYDNKKLNILPQIQEYQRAKDPQLLKQDLEEIQFQIDALKADLTPKEQELQKAFG